MRVPGFNFTRVSKRRARHYPVRPVRPVRAGLGHDGEAMMITDAAPERRRPGSAIRPAVLALLAALSSAAPAQPAPAPERSTAEEAVALMAKAQAYVRAHGLDQAAAEFNRPASPFNSKSEINRHGDLYLYSVDRQGFQLIHGINARIRGTHKYDMRDPNGVYVIRELVRLCFATPEGRGWVEYQWPHPITRQMQTKRGYVERVPGSELCLGTGIYL